MKCYLPTRTARYRVHTHTSLYQSSRQETKPRPVTRLYSIERLPASKRWPSSTSCVNTSRGKSAPYTTCACRCRRTCLSHSSDSTWEMHIVTTYTSRSTARQTCSEPHDVRVNSRIASVHVCIECVDAIKNINDQWVAG